MKQHVRRKLVLEIFEKIEEEINGLETIEIKCPWRDGEPTGFVVTVDTKDITSRLTIRTHSLQVQIMTFETEESVLDTDAAYQTMEEVHHTIDRWFFTMKETIKKIRA